MKPINRAIIIEAIIAVVLFASTIAAIILAIREHSILWALTGPVTGALACFISEDVQRLIRYKRKHKV